MPEPQAGSARHGLGSACRYFPGNLNTHRCHPGEIWIRAHGGRQIVRVLRSNPGEGTHYLGDIFRGRHAIASRLPAFALPRLAREATRTRLNASEQTAKSEEPK